MKEVFGDLISKALEGNFDVIAHGCNCLCIQSAGIAPQMVKAFDTINFPMEASWRRGDINKLGQIDALKYLASVKKELKSDLWVVNAYTQYAIGNDKPLDYEALTLCMRKINHVFKGLHIGLPQIGCGLAGGNWRIVKKIIEKELKDCLVTIVIYKK